MSSVARLGERLRASRGLLRFAYVVCVAWFFWLVAQYYHPVTGFSSLILIGDALDARKMPALREVPHFVLHDSAGYDGAFYVQLALYPTLDDPALKEAIDNLPYRARRILFSWTAWLLGAGRPAWVVQAHALLNVLCWVALAWVILRWFPPDSWENFLRWLGVMFSPGVCMSVRGSLVDGPSLLLVALAVRWLEDGHRLRGGATLALAGLGKETNLLAGVALAEPAALRAPRGWLRVGAAAALVALPLAAWMSYIRWKFGPVGDAGMSNFTLPLAGLAEKWASVFADFAESLRTRHRAAFAATLGVTVQMLFFLLWRRPEKIWWRVGAAFALLGVFIGTPVWEGYPGAFTRVLLPMTLAFNVLVPRGRAWLAVLLLGNLGVYASLRHFNLPSAFPLVYVERVALSAVPFVADAAWEIPDGAGRKRGSWVAGDGVLRFRNRTGQPLHVTLTGEVRAAAAGRQLAIGDGQTTWWSNPISQRPAAFAMTRIMPPGETALHFRTDRPAERVPARARPVAFRVENFQVIVRPAPAAR